MATPSIPVRGQRAAMEKVTPAPRSKTGRLRVVLHHLLNAFRRGGVLQEADEVQGHVDAGGDAGGRDDVAVVHPALSVDDCCVAAEVLKLGDRAPVGGGRLSLEEAGL